MQHGWTIFRYLLGAVAPYFVSSWLLLSVILFVQQAGRFSDIFFSANIPSALIWQLAIALIPNVIAFTCPMAVLVGTVVGFSKLQNDGELVAIRAAGVGNFHVLLPVFATGLLLAGLTFAINLYGVPIAAGVVRQIATRTAIYKLESPIEPGVFNTEVAGYTIYVRDGDVDNGEWKDIFIHTENQVDGTVRLITSERGRIDSSEQASELVLEEAVSTTITPKAEVESFVSEKIGEVRLAIKTRRGELIEKLANTESSIEEMGLLQLSQYAGSKQGSERMEAEIVWQRRILLSVTPLILSLLGAALVLRFGRSGRGLTLFISLLGLITYYLLGFLGEQLVRTGRVNVLVAGVMPVTAGIAGALWLLRRPSSRVSFGSLFNFHWIRARLASVGRSLELGISRGISTNIRDLDVIFSLIWYFLLSLAFLSSIFLLFTGFELWRFAGTMPGGTVLLGKYLFYLIPFMYLQLAPSSAMIAVLATFAIKSRQNEIVTWVSAGQSAYRLIAPCLFILILLGGFNFLVQETRAPAFNVRQESLRQELRSRGKVQGPTRFWVAEGARIYSFFNIDDASDNDKQFGSTIIYEFEGRGRGLQALYRAPSARWDSGSVILVGPVRVSKLLGGHFESSDSLPEVRLTAENNPFKELKKKPSQLSLREVREQVDLAEAPAEQRIYSIAAERKWSTLVLPLVIGLFTAPFAISLDRKGKAATVGYAVAIWLVFLGLTAVFEQLGLSGALPTAASVWAPIAVFAMVGLYLLSRMRT